MQEQVFYVQDVLRDSLSMLERQGYRISETRKYQTIFRGLSQFSHAQYNGEYSIEIGEAFIRSLKERDVPLSAGYMRSNIVEVQRANRIIEGDTDWRPSKPSLEYEDSIYRHEVKEYAEYLRNSGKTKCDKGFIQFLLWFRSRGFDPLPKGKTLGLHPFRRFLKFRLFICEKPAYSAGFLPLHLFCQQGLAGVAGFEPTHARVKVWCLTAWRHPNMLF